MTAHTNRTPLEVAKDNQRAANVLKAFEPLRDVAPTASTGDVARDLNGRGFRVRVPELHIAVDVGVGKDRTVRVVHDRADAVKDTATIGETSRLWLTWSDPAFVRERFGGLAPGSYCLAKPTVAVMREAADGVEAGRLRVTIDGDYLRVFKHAESKPGLDGDHETRASERGRVAPARVNNAAPGKPVQSAHAGKYTPRGMCRRCGHHEPNTMMGDSLCGFCRNEVGEEPERFDEATGSMPRVEAHTDLGDGLGLPLVCTGPAGLDGCRFCSPRSGATGECESHRRAHAELEDELAAEAARDEWESAEESEER